MNRLMKNLGLIPIVILFAAMFIFPLYIMFMVSVSAPQDMLTQRPPYLIRNFTLEHLRDVISSGEAFFSPLKQSCLVAFFTSIFSLLIAIPAAYVISRFNYKLKYALVLIIFMTRMVPEVSIALPVSVSFIKMGLFDTTLGLVLAHLIRTLPITCFILVGVFSSFPKELEKQARIDGCSRIKAITKVVLPLSAGGIAVAGIFSFLCSWDEFIYASYLSLANTTMPLKMYYYISRGDVFYSATYALIITLPVLLVTLALQKYIRPDYLSGAIKG
ncbi:carbohydrate ABC transporter permease [Candidatus Omnitrophota bacterium]